MKASSRMADVQSLDLRAALSGAHLVVEIVPDWKSCRGGLLLGSDSEY
jgi:hypothetical protein